jgi:hypothetical protein
MVVLEHSYFLIDNRVERDPLNLLTSGQTNLRALAVAMFYQRLPGYNERHAQPLDSGLPVPATCTHRSRLLGR